MNRFFAVLFFVTNFLSMSYASDTGDCAKQLADLSLDPHAMNMAELEKVVDLLEPKDDDLTLGERSLIDACKNGYREHARYLVSTENINPNVKDPETGLSPFIIALHKDRTLAAYLLGNGAKPHAHLKKTSSIYSESFMRSDINAIQFLLRKHIPYRKKNSDVDTCRHEDIRRLLGAGNIAPLSQAFASGLLTPATITPAVLSLARGLKEMNPDFDERITPLLERISQCSGKKLKRLQGK